MKPIDKVITEIAREHLGIETLEERKSDRLDFHNVSVWGVKAALLAAYQAGQSAINSPPAEAAAALAALKEIRLALLHYRHWAPTMPGHLVTVAEGAITGAEATRSLPAKTPAGPPIVLLTVRGGCVEAAEATIPLRVILEDWDCEDRLTATKPYRAELPPTGGLSRKKLTQCLRRL